MDILNTFQLHHGITQCAGFVSGFNKLFYPYLTAFGVEHPRYAFVFLSEGATTWNAFNLALKNMVKNGTPEAVASVSLRELHKSYFNENPKLGEFAEIHKVANEPVKFSMINGLSPFYRQAIKIVPSEDGLKYQLVFDRMKLEELCTNSLSEKQQKVYDSISDFIHNANFNGIRYNPSLFAQSPDGRWAVNFETLTKIC